MAYYDVFKKATDDDGGVITLTVDVSAADESAMGLYKIVMIDWGSNGTNADRSGYVY